MIEKVCSYCGKTFMAKTDRAKYCSYECRLGSRRDKLCSEYVSRAQHIKRTCPQCGNDFITNTSKQKFCCEECQLNYHGIHIAPIIEKECVVCGKTFETKIKHQITCGGKCSYIWRAKRRERRFTSDNVVDTDITLRKVFDRDDGICQICGEPCDFNDKEIRNGTFIAGHNYPSVDHIQPLAKGGKHSWGNVQLAHKQCNSIKRDSIITKGESAQCNTKELVTLSEN